MNTKRYGFVKHLLFTVFLAAAMMSLTAVCAMAEEVQDIEEGTYYLKAANGNANGQVLYCNEKASDQNISMMFESCGGSHADYEIWFITANRNFDGWYGIYLAKDYYGDKDYCKRIEMDNLTGRDQPYLTSTKGPHVFCGAFGNQDDGFRFYNQKNDHSYTNLMIRSHDEDYRFNRHKETKLFKSDLIYVNANKDNDTTNKLWELIPVNYVRKMSSAKPAVTTKSGKKTAKVTIKWNKLRKKIKSNEFWKSAKYVEIEYGTNKNFKKSATKSRKIRKNKINKVKAKTALSKLKKNKTYYIRARMIDKKGVCSNWSKTVKIKTKK